MENTKNTLEINGLEELTKDEVKQTNGGALFVLAFAGGFGLGMAYNRVTKGYWLYPR